MARPTKYSDALADKICDIIATSNKGLSAICEDESFPSRSTIHQWIKDNEKFSDKYARAKEDQADFLAEEIIKIADTENKTEVEFIGSEGSSTTIHDNVQRSRLQIDARKWIASKLKPKKYGDKIDVTSDGDKITTYNVGFKKPDTED